MPTLSAARLSVAAVTVPVARATLSPVELAYCTGRRHWRERVAGRLVAKVVVSRVLIRSGEAAVPPGAISIVPGPARFPRSGLTGEPREPRCHCLAHDPTWREAVDAVRLSISHTAGVAVAVAAIGATRASTTDGGHGTTGALELPVAVVVAPHHGRFDPDPLVEHGVVRTVQRGDVMGTIRSQGDAYPVTSPVSGRIGGFWVPRSSPVRRGQRLAWLLRGDHAED